MNAHRDPPGVTGPWRHRHRHRSRERGAAVLGIAVMLLAVAALWVLATGRILLLAQRSAADLARSTQAFEAAEAGLDWALAGLNAQRRVAAACQATTAETAATFRRLFLQHDPETGRYTPTGLSATCTRRGGGWSCRCLAAPASDAGEVVTQADPDEPAETGPAFRITFLPADRAGVVRLQADGCSSDAGPCASTPARRREQPDAVARHETAYALLTGLPRPPDAALTARGAIDVDAATLALVNTDPATGLAARAGGRFNGPLARLTGPAGTPRARLVAADDTALRDLDEATYFSGPFGATLAAWGRLPTVQRLDCTGADCGPALTATIAAMPDSPLIRVGGDLTLRGMRTFGTPDHPVVIVVDGEARVEGDVLVHGVLYARALRWERSGPTAGVRGAVILGGDYSGDGAPALVHDRAVLERLRLDSGGFVRVNGAWRDF